MAGLYVNVCTRQTLLKLYRAKKPDWVSRHFFLFCHLRLSRDQRLGPKLGKLFFSAISSSLRQKRIFFNIYTVYFNIYGIYIYIYGIYTVFQYIFSIFYRYIFQNILVEKLKFSQSTENFKRFSEHTTCNFCRPSVVKTIDAHLNFLQFDLKMVTSVKYCLTPHL